MNLSATEWYYGLKTIHVVSATVLFGTGLGTAFFKWIVDRSGNVAAIRVVSERVVLADWLFTSPAVIVQAVTGFALAGIVGYPLTHGWVAYGIALYVIAGMCWIPVVVLQIRMRDLAQRADRAGTPLEERYWRYARAWFWLGVPAFIAVVLAIGVMIVKPG
jgi:uncharacterized membrane protein